MLLKLVGIVSVLIAVQFNEAADYTRLGCYRDSFFRTMSDQLSMNVKSVEECANLAKRAGYSTFGVQNGKECYSKNEAAAKYNSQGDSTGCTNGMGGDWANDVYQFKAETFKDLGCWKDNLYSRALPTRPTHTKYKDAVALRVCADMTRVKGFKVFAVQQGYCLTGDNAENTYKKHGKSSSCVNGTGASLVNSVYQLPAEDCYLCNGKDNCSKITCKTDSYCYKMSKETGKETGGVKSRVTLAGCMSSCTSQGESDGCVGQKNCNLTCCRSGYCNGPNAPVMSALKCYTCASTKDWSSCNDAKKEVTCASGISHCLKAEVVSAKGGGVNVTSYMKLCSDSCDAKSLSQCNKKTFGVTVSCKINCCTGNLCNAGSLPLVSRFIMLICALLSVVFHLGQ